MQQQHLRSRRRVIPRLLLACVSCASLLGCTTPVVSDISFGGLTPRAPNFCQPNDGIDCAPNLAEFPSYAQRGQEITIFPMGRGTCGQITVDFGDGTPVLTLQNQKMGSTNDPGPGIKHTYAGWQGRKLVKIQGTVNCLGSESRFLMVADDPMDKGTYNLAFNANPQLCSAVPGVPALRKGTTVRIWADAVIQYGPFLKFDEGGDPNTPTPADFPFPQHNKFSIVYRVGTQTVQALGKPGKFRPVLFRTTQTAPLEICVNDRPADLGDNRGVGHFVITVNEATAE